MNNIIEKKVTIIKRTSKEFPVLLKTIYNPPKQLFCLGAPLDNRDKIAIVGMRKCSKEGIQITKRITDQCVNCGLIIVSGLAIGIDTAVHEQAIASGGQTIAVLPCGLNRVYQNFSLMRKILQNGGSIITEYEINASARKYTFLERNRIISGLGKGVIVVEADYKSGALNTANHALKQNRMVWAIPGNIYKLQSHGTNNLIKKGESALLTDIKDLEDIFHFNNIKTIKKSLNLSIEERLIWQFLERENLSTSELQQRTGLEFGQLILLLTNLELEKIIFQNFLNKWEKFT